MRYLSDPLTWRASLQSAPLCLVLPYPVCRLVCILCAPKMALPLPIMLSPLSLAMSFDCFGILDLGCSTSEHTSNRCTSCLRKESGLVFVSRSCCLGQLVTYPVHHMAACTSPLVRRFHSFSLSAHNPQAHLTLDHLFCSRCESKIDAAVGPEFAFCRLQRSAAVTSALTCVLQNAVSTWAISRR